MWLTFAMYIPKPSQLWEALIIIGVIFVVLWLFGLHYGLHSVSLVPAMLLGCSLLLVPDVRSAIHEVDGDYGDFCRRQSNTNHGNAVFALASYFHVGRGKFVAFTGMVIPLAILLAVKNARSSPPASPNKNDITSTVI